MKMVNEVLGKIKGEDKINDTLTGKGAFSVTGFNDLVNAMINDTSFKIPTYGKDGKKDGEISISELVRNDIAKTADKAKYPQKSEAGVFNSSEIVTTGLAKAIPYICLTWLAAGKKFELPNTGDMSGFIYLQNVPGGTKVSQVRDMKTGANIGTSETKTKDHIEVRAKSSAPDWLKTKVRKDVNGKVVN